MKWLLLQGFDLGSDFCEMVLSVESIFDFFRAGRLAFDVGLLVRHSVELSRLGMVV